MSWRQTVLAGPIPLLAPSPSPTPAVTPSCAADSDLCHFIYQQTNIAWLAESGYWALVKPVRILFIILLAIVVRFVINRTIDRLIRHTVDGGPPSLLRPLHERIPQAIRTATAMPSERRRQRAEALGSVLRSGAAVTIFSITVMLVLGELGVNLGPILASAGIVGIALGFGAQNLVKDFLAGLFMLLEDQYGVGDVIDVGNVGGTVEAVGLRITTIRDVHGVLWYLRNGEMIQVGNKSQGWAVVIVDIPVGFVAVETAMEVLRTAAATIAEDPEYTDDLISAPEIVGVETITTEGATLRTTVKTASNAQWRVGRELRRRLSEALHDAGLTAQISASRLYVRQPIDAAAADTDQSGPT